MPLPYRRISFPVGSSYHQGWTIRDQQGKLVDLTGATITLAVYPSGAPLNGSAVAWLTKTNAPGGGLVVIDGPGAVFRGDFLPQDTFNQIGAYPWEVKAQLADAPDWRSLSKGYLILRAARLDP